MQEKDFVSSTRSHTASMRARKEASAVLPRRPHAANSICIVQIIGKSGICTWQSLSTALDHDMGVCSDLIGPIRETFPDSIVVWRPV